MFCDDCYKEQAVMHIGHGICLCDTCVKNFDLPRVLGKMKDRHMVLKRLAEGEWVDFDLLKQVPINMLMP